VLFRRRDNFSSASRGARVLYLLVVCAYLDCVFLCGEERQFSVLALCSVAMFVKQEILPFDESHKKSRPHMNWCIKVTVQWRGCIDQTAHNHTSSRKRKHIVNMAVCAYGPFSQKKKNIYIYMAVCMIVSNFLSMNH
jgi:hypothetical protein